MSHHARDGGAEDEAEDRAEQERFDKEMQQALYALLVTEDYPKGRFFERDLCEAVVNTRLWASPNMCVNALTELDEEALKNPFAKLVRLDGCMCCTGYPYEDIARVFLAKYARFPQPGQPVAVPLPDENPTARRYRFGVPPCSCHQTQQYICLKCFISSTAEEPRGDRLPHWMTAENSDLGMILYYFFEGNRKAFDVGIETVCRIVYQGVPLHVATGDGAFHRLPIGNDLEVYLQQKYLLNETASGALQTDRPSIQFPRWAGEHFLRFEDLKAHEVLYGNTKQHMGVEATLLLRAALHRMIGIPENPSVGTTAQKPPAQHRRLSAITEEARTLFNSDGTFGPTHCKSLQKSLNDWLRKTHGCNTAEQQAIWVMVRPDRTA